MLPAMFHRQLCLQISACLAVGVQFGFSKTKTIAAVGRGTV